MTPPTEPPFRIKICGITQSQDADVACEAGADALGLNFYPRSAPVFLKIKRDAVADAARSRAQLVGLFVNATAEEIESVVERLDLNLVQLHGDETPELVAAIRGWLPAGVGIIRALRVSAAGLGPVEAYVEQCRKLGVRLAGLLLDAYRPGAYGGTGEVGDWATAAQLVERFDDLPLVLAGGLTAENVATAIDSVRPAAVDTASGVESAPGVKDAAKVGQFVAAAQGAFARRGR